MGSQDPDGQYLPVWATDLRSLGSQVKNRMVVEE